MRFAAKQGICILTDQGAKLVKSNLYENGGKKGAVVWRKCYLIGSPGINQIANITIAIRLIKHRCTLASIKRCKAKCSQAVPKAM
jgi:hypothetical protein